MIGILYTKNYRSSDTVQLPSASSHACALGDVCVRPPTLELSTNLILLFVQNSFFSFYLARTSFSLSLSLCRLISICNCLNIHAIIIHRFCFTVLVAFLTLLVCLPGVSNALYASVSVSPVCQS